MRPRCADCNSYLCCDVTHTSAFSQPARFNVSHMCHLSPSDGLTSSDVMLQHDCKCAAGSTHLFVSVSLSAAANLGVSWLRWANAVLSHSLFPT
jgi:hypothetical protein